MDDEKNTITLSDGKHGDQGRIKDVEKVVLLKMAEKMEANLFEYLLGNVQKLMGKWNGPDDVPTIKSALADAKEGMRRFGIERRREDASTMQGMEHRPRPRFELEARIVEPEGDE